MGDLLLPELCQGFARKLSFFYIFGGPMPLSYIYAERHWKILLDFGSSYSCNLKNSIEKFQQKRLRNVYEETDFLSK